MCRISQFIDINAYGEYFPCSFTEGTKGWEKGIDVISCRDFVEECFPQSM